MAQPTRWYSSFFLGLLVMAPAPICGQLPNPPLGPTGQNPVGPNFAGQDYAGPGSTTPRNPAAASPLAPTPLSALPTSPLGPLNSAAGSQLPNNPAASNPSLGNPALGNPAVSNPAAGQLSPGGISSGGPAASGALSPNPMRQPAGGLQPVPTNPSADPAGALERGVISFSDAGPAGSLRNRNQDQEQEIQSVNYETEQVDGSLSAMEQRYAAWWREVLGTADIEGQGVELKSLLQNTSGPDRVPMIREYWRLSEAIVAVHIHRETLETWQRATSQQAQQSLPRTLVEVLSLQIEQAKATVVAEQEHLGLWLQRHGLPQQARPVDAPYLGLYDTKLEQLQQQGTVSTDLSVLAYQVDQRKQEVLDDEQVVDWADQEWERARTSGDLQRMATMIQLRQSAYLLWLTRVTRYNEAIADYAFRVAGTNVPVPQQLAMLLRQPIVDGRLTDIRTDAWFRSGPTNVGADFREIAPVSYNQPSASYNQPLYGVEPPGVATGNWQPARGR